MRNNELKSRKKLNLLESVGKFEIKTGSEVKSYLVIVDDDPLAFFKLQLGKSNAASHSGIFLKEKTDWNFLLENLETNSWKYKFDEITSHYKSNINPVIAYYNELQRVKLTLKSSDKERKYIESFIKDIMWKNSVRAALRNDIKELDAFLLGSPTSNYYTDKAVTLKLRFIDCLKTFK